MNNEPRNSIPAPPCAQGHHPLASSPPAPRPPLLAPLLAVGGSHSWKRGQDQREVRNSMGGRSGEPAAGIRPAPGLTREKMLPGPGKRNVPVRIFKDGSCCPLEFSEVQQTNGERSAAPVGYKAKQIVNYCARLHAGAIVLRTSRIRRCAGPWIRSQATPRHELPNVRPTSEWSCSSGNQLASSSDTRGPRDSLPDD